jgi:hypothetical protein
VGFAGVGAKLKPTVHGPILPLQILTEPLAMPVQWSRAQRHSNYGPTPNALGLASQPAKLIERLHH